MSNLLPSAVPWQRCITTCLSSGPSTNKTRGCGEPGPGTTSANLDTLIGSDLQVLFRVLDCAQSFVVSVESDENPVGLI